jgi:predicted transcriptional regulator
MEDTTFLCRRHEYLDAVNPEPKSKREVADALDKSPSTARKHMKKLEGQGIVEKTEDGYTLTDFGETIRAKLRGAQRTYEAKEAFEALDAPSGVLAHARFVPSRRHVPTEPLEEFTRHIVEADELRGLVPVLFPRYLGFHHEQILGGMDAEFMMERGISEYLCEEHGDVLEESVKHGTRLYVTDEEMSHGLALLDKTRVGVLVYDDEGGVLGYVSFASSRAWEHFESVHEERKKQAERFEP